MSFGIPVRNGLSISLLSTTSLSSGRGLRPSLALNFLSGTLDSRITFTRSSSATRVNASGLVESVTANTPRFDYDPVTLAPRGLLVEEQRTNLLTYSEQFNNAFWQKTNITVTSAATVSPDGTTNAQRIAATASAVTNIFSTNAAVAATSATYSVYVKQGTGPTTANRFAIRNNTTATTLLLVTVNLATGTVISYINGTTGASLQNAGNGWWRVVLTVTSGVTSGDLLSGYAGFVGSAQTAGDHLFAWGAQLEAGAFATSYIPCVASQVTRTADVATITGANFSQWYNQSEGTFVVEYQQGTSTATQSVLVADDETALNRIAIQNDNSSAATVTPGSFVVDNNVAQAALTYASTTAGSVNKIAFAFKANNFAGAMNGGVPVVDDAGTVPIVSRLNIGSLSGAAQTMNSHIRSIQYYNTRLPNAQLQALTS